MEMRSAGRCDQGVMEDERTVPEPGTVRSLLRVRTAQPDVAVFLPEPLIMALR